MPPIDLVRHCFIEPFGEGSSRTPRDLTPIARLLDAIMRRTLLSRICYHEGLTRSIYLYTLNSEAEITGRRALGSERYLDFRSSPSDYMRFAMDRQCLLDALMVVWCPL